jgi:hypothetical protein
VSAVALLKANLDDWKWRLNNLYTIEDKAGCVVRFQMNASQEYLFDNMHFLNVILKARQLGFSTFISIFFLDVSLFNPNRRCGVVDATIDDAKKKLAKMKFAYDHLPYVIKLGMPIKTSNAFKLEFENGSAIEVGTSHRGGTFQYLHVSELGKIAAKYPEKAREIRTGALNTIQAGAIAFIESTAEGQEGDFFELCQTSEAKSVRGDKLSALDFKFHFFAWHQAPEYTLDPEGIVIDVEAQTYFAKLEKQGIKLSAGQKAWYVKKAESQRDDMKREYPSTPAEAFEAAIEGAIYGAQMALAESGGRVGWFPAIDGVPVHTFWDIGRRDYTSIWFVQILVGKVRVVGFYPNCMAELPHYAEYLLGTARVQSAFPEFVFGNPTPGIYAKNKWIEGTAYWPHDGRVKEWGGGRTRLEQGVKAGLKVQIGVEQSLHDGINAGRATIPLCEFDQTGCGEGLKVLKLYKWDWDDARGAWMTGTPRHDTNSHGADAWRNLATTWREVIPDLPPQKKPIAELLRQPTMDELVNASMEDDD